MEVKIGDGVIELPDRMSVGDLQTLNHIIHGQLSKIMAHDDSFSISAAFHAASMTSDGLYRWMKDHEDWS